MSRLTDAVLECLLKVAIGTFAVALGIGLALPAVAVGGCSECITGQTFCTYGCGKEVNCSKPPYTECGCVICNTCCLA